MGSTLGREGKLNAVNCNIGAAVTDYGTLYIGLLQVAPADMDAMTLATLVGVGAGNEHAIAGTFYTARKVISFGTPTVSATGAVALSNVGSAVSWTNVSGSSKTVAAYFITDALTGTSGHVLWVGTPDVGTITVANNGTLQFTDGDLTVRVD